MKTALWLAASLLLPRAAHAVETLPELPSLSQFQQRLSEAPPVLTPVGQPVASRPPSAPPAVPARFSIYERFFSFTNTFDLYEGDTRKFGTLTEAFFSFGRTFTYTDAANRKVAVAHARVFSIGTTVDVADEQGRPIGTIREDVLKSLFKVYTLYHVLDASGREIATSQKTDFLSTEIVLRDPSGRVVAEVRRDFKTNFFRLTDKWDVTIVDPAAVDPRLIVVIGAYKTAVDNDRRNQSSGSDDDN